MNLFQHGAFADQVVAEKHRLRVLETKNPISLAMTVEGGSSATAVGSMLFTRGVSGTRVVTGQDSKTIEGHTFTGWGGHCDETDTAYLTAAAGWG